jgi:hypothetical protein
VESEEAVRMEGAMLSRKAKKRKNRNSTRMTR